MGNLDREKAGEQGLTMRRFVEILLWNKWVGFKAFGDLCGAVAYLESGTLVLDGNSDNEIQAISPVDHLK